MGQSMITMSEDGEIVFHGSCVTSDNGDTVKDDDLPSLVEVEQKTSSSYVDNRPRHRIVNPPTENPPVYPTLKLNNTETGSDDMPSLIETDPDKPKILEPAPVVYKTLIVRNERILLPEKVIKDIPYLDTLFSGRFVTECSDEGLVKTDEFEPSLIKVIIRYVEDKKYYKLLACLPKDDDVFELLETFRFLALEPPINTELSKLRGKLKDPPSTNVTTQKELVEYAFALFYIHDQINWKHERSLRDKIYNTIIYVFKTSNSCFKPRARWHFQKLVLRCITLSFNQYQKVKSIEVSGNLDQSDDEHEYSGHRFSCHCGACSDLDDDMLSLMMADMWYDSWNPYPYLYDPEYDSDDLLGYSEADSYLDDSDDFSDASKESENEN